MHLYLAFLFHRDYFGPVRHVPPRLKHLCQAMLIHSGLCAQALKERKDA